MSEINQVEKVIDKMLDEVTDQDVSESMYDKWFVATLWFTGDVDLHVVQGGGLTADDIFRRGGELKYKMEDPRGWYGYATDDSVVGFSRTKEGAIHGAMFTSAQYAGGRHPEDWVTVDPDDYLSTVGKLGGTP